MELQPLDYEILKFINKFSEVTKDEVIKNFVDKIEVEHRLKKLLNPEHNIIKNLGRIAEPGTNYIYKKVEHETDEIGLSYVINTGVLCITDKGRATLQDYLYQTSREERRYKETKAIANRSNYISITAVIISFLAFLYSIFKN